MRLLIRLARWLIILAAVWAALVFGLPAVRARAPLVCDRWKLSGGFCTESVQRGLATADAWVQRILTPLPKHGKVQRALTQTSEAFRNVERLVRERVGDERINEALRGADIALQQLERTAGGGSWNLREKLTDVPENAQALLSRVREAFDRLRRVLLSTSRRAEEVSDAVDETKKALDALSNALPDASK